MWEVTGAMRWISPILILSFLLTSSPVMARPTALTPATESVPSSPEPAQPTWRLGKLTPGGEWLFKTFPKHIFYDLKYTFWNPWHILALAAGAGATLGVHQADDDIQNYFDSKNRMGAADNILGVMGSPYLLLGASASAFIGAKLADAPKAALTAGTMTEALLVTEAFTLGLKLATQRTRPDGSDLSFPSAHASGCFALATVVEVFYGPLYGVPSYAFATAVAVSRLAANKHFASDVMAGALLGTLIGLGTAQFHKHEYSNLFITPTITSERAELNLTYLF